MGPLVARITWSEESDGRLGVELTLAWNNGRMRDMNWARERLRASTQGMESFLDKASYAARMQIGGPTEGVDLVGAVGGALSDPFELAFWRAWGRGCPAGLAPSCQHHEVQ